VILTNGTIDPQRLTIARTGLVALVDGVIVTEEVGLHKPHPEPFRRAAALAGAAPSEAAMVGDNFSTDIVGALGAGFCRAVWVTRRRALPPSDPRLVVVRRLGEVLAAVSSPA
jgi:putative hydrolase of the HAD superfamily